MKKRKISVGCVHTCGHSRTYWITDRPENEAWAYLDRKAAQPCPKCKAKHKGRLSKGLAVLNEFVAGELSK